MSGAEIATGRKLSAADLNGLVLAGGYSTRMGSDKGLLVYHDKPQREHLFNTLGFVCASVFTSCRPEQNVPGTLNPVFDLFDIPGPLNGILSAFSLGKESAWLSVAVDMPFVDVPVLRMLIDGRDRTRLATCFYNPETKGPEPLLTIWEREAHAFLQMFVSKGNISPREFLKSHPVRMIAPSDAKILRSFNSPEDIKR